MSKIQDNSVNCERIKNFKIAESELLKFIVLRIFFMNFDFKNGCKNEFKDINVESYS